MSKMNTRAVCDCAIYLCLLGAVVANTCFLGAEDVAQAAMQMCGEEMYENTTHGCCGGVVYDLETHGCCNGTKYDLFTKGCCNNSVFDISVYCCCNSECDGMGTVTLLPIADCTENP